MSLSQVDVFITARGEQTQSPWLWQLGNDFGVRVNIVKASIEPGYGWVHVQLEGPVEEIQRSIAWLMTTGMHVDSQQRSVGVQ